MIPATLATGRFGFKVVLIVGVLSVGVAAILASLSRRLVELSVLRGLWGLGNAVFFATALVVLVGLANEREWVVGLFELAVGLGFAVGPLLGGSLGEVSWRLPLFVCGLFMLVALVVAARRLGAAGQVRQRVRVADFWRTYRRAFVALCAVTAAYNLVLFDRSSATPPCSSASA